MDAKTRIEAVEARRAARKTELAARREEQQAIDLEALDELEVKHGDGRVARLDPERYEPGLPTFVAIRTPTRPEYQRFCDMVSAAVKKDNSKAREAAQELLAKSCWIYPAAEGQGAMLDAFPGLLLSIAIKASQLVEAKEAAEGKG